MREPGSNRRPEWDLAVVIGAGGMGMAVARRLAQRRRVLIADIAGDRASAAAAQLRDEGGDVSAIACDVTDPASVESLAGRVGELGSFRVLAHVAGLSPSMGDFHRIIQVNLNGAAAVANALLPLASTGTAAIFVASLAAHNFEAPEDIAEMLRDAGAADLSDRLEHALGPEKATPHLAYPLSKLGLRMMCQREAVAWGERGARIVSLSPGIIATPMGTAEFAKSKGKRTLYELTPLQRDGTMHEITNALEFLASDQASFISGTDLLVDGGLAGRMAAARSHETGPAR